MSDSLQLGPPRFPDGRHHRLITNPYHMTVNDDFDALREPSDAMLQVREYLKQVLEGGYCSFVKGIERSNGYYVAVQEGDPKDLQMDHVIQRLAGAFRRQQHHDFSDQYRDTYPLTYIDAFHHPDAKSDDFLQRMLSLKRRHRIPLMEKRLKFEIAHPRRELGGSKVPEQAERLSAEPLFRSEIPLIMMRAFHRADKIFMTSKKDQHVYERVFGKRKASDFGWA